MVRLIPKFKWMLVSFAAIFMAAATVSQVLAQDHSPPRNWSVDMLGGLSHTYFNVGSEFLMPSAAFNVRYATNSRFAVRGSFAGSSFNGTGENWFGQNYENQTISLSLQPMYTLIRDDNVNFSLYGGVGVLKNDVTVTLENPQGTGTRFAGEEYDAINTNYSLGSELRFRLSPRLDFLLQAQQNYTNTAKMDGYDFEIGRSGERIDQSWDDSYLTAMAGITIKFGSNRTRHATWHKKRSNDHMIKPLAQKMEQDEEQNRQKNERQDNTIEEIQRTVAKTTDLNADGQARHRELAQRVDSLEARLQKYTDKIASTEKQPVSNTGNYYVIGAAFRSMDRARVALKQLHEQGFNDASILPQMNALSTFNYVTFTRGMTADESRKLLINKYLPINKKAWILKYDGKSITQL